MATTGREFFTVKTVSEALTGFRPGHITPVETVPLGAAYGRVPDAVVVAEDGARQARLDLLAATGRFP